MPLGRVLVTDGEQRAALAAVRSLGRAGYQVDVAGSTDRPLAGASRFASRTRRVADPLGAPEDFAAQLTELVTRERYQAVLPITDAAHLAVLPIREQLRPAVVAGPPLATFQAAADKEHVLQLAERCGIRAPPQVVLAGPIESGTLPSSIRFPAVAKPARSVAGVGESLGKFSVRHAVDQAELCRVLTELPPTAFPVLVQERIVGPGTGLFFLRWNGRIVARFAHRRIREKPPAGGVSVLAESVAAPDDLVHRAELLLDALDWQGVAMVELKTQTATGVPYIMEINGRLWGSVQLAIDAGVDFPRLLVEAALGRQPAAPPGWRVGARSRWLWGDIDHLLLRLTRSPTQLSLPPGAGSRLAAIGRFLRWNPFREADSVFRFDDPGPFFRESRQWLTALRG